MANLWRLIWVNAAHTAEIGRIMCTFPEAANNSGGSVSKARYGTAAALSEAVVSDTYLTSCNLGKYLEIYPNGAIYDGFSAAGFLPSISINDIQVGQRFKIGRWDANHSYIEVTSKTDNTSSGTIAFRYRRNDGPFYPAYISSHRNGQAR